MKVILFLTLLVSLVSCNKKPADTDLKSPCVSAHNGPCDNRVNPNLSWLPRVV